MPHPRALAGYVAAVLLALGVVFGSVGASLAQDAGATPVTPIVDDEDTKAFPAAIMTGSCDQPGDTVYELSIIGIPEGSEIVHPPALPGYLGVTEIPDATIDDIANGDHVLAIFQGTEDAGDMMSCGLIGGARYDENLLFTVSPVDDPFTGSIVHMSEANGVVTVTVYLTVAVQPAGGADQGTPQP